MKKVILAYLFLNIILLSSLSSLSSLRLWADDEKKLKERDNLFNIYYQKAARYYIKGDLINSIKFLKKSSEIKPDNLKVKHSLFNIYVKRGAAFYKAKLYNLAVTEFLKAKKLAVKDKELDEMYKLALQNLKTKKPFVSESKVQEKIKKNLDSYLMKNKADTIFEKIFTRFSEKEDEFFNKFITMQKTLLQKEAQKSRSFSIIYFVSAVIIVIAIVIFILKKFSINLSSFMQMFYKKIEERDKKLIEFLKKEISLKGSTNEGNKLLVSSSAVTMLDDKNYKIRKKGLELLKDDIKDISSDTTQGTEETLNKIKTLLNDDNNQVKAYACVALFHIYTELIKKTLTDMTKSKDKWMRASAINSIGQINDPGLIDIILDNLDEKEKLVIDVMNSVCKHFINTKVPIESNKLTIINEFLYKNSQ